MSPIEKIPLLLFFHSLARSITKTLTGSDLQASGIIKAFSLKLLSMTSLIFTGALLVQHLELTKLIKEQLQDFCTENEIVDWRSSQKG